MYPEPGRRRIVRAEGRSRDPGRIPARRLKRIAASAAAVLFLFCAVKLVCYTVRSARTRWLQKALVFFMDAPEEGSGAAEAEDREDGSGLRYIYQRVSGEASPKLLKLKEECPDLVGWVRIPGVADLPVVWRDNRHYLDHDLYGNKSDAGTVFLNEAHPFAAETQYLVLHGHSMYDASMFSYVTHYRSAGFARKHPELIFTTLYSEDRYRVIGALYLSDSDLPGAIRLGSPAFGTGAEFNAFIDSLRERALYFTNDPVLPSHALMALVTCYRENKIVVFFERTASVPFGSEGI